MRDTAESSVVIIQGSGPATTFPGYPDHALGHILRRRILIHGPVRQCHAFDVLPLHLDLASVKTVETHQFIFLGRSINMKIPRRRVEITQKFSIAKRLLGRDRGPDGGEVIRLDFEIADLRG